MTRVEENRMALNEISKSVERQPVGNYEIKTAFQLEIIATMLIDISRSLAILADKVEKEEGKDEEK